MTRPTETESAAYPEDDRDWIIVDDDSEDEPPEDAGGDGREGDAA